MCGNFSRQRIVEADRNIEPQTYGDVIELRGMGFVGIGNGSEISQNGFFKLRFFAWQGLKSRKLTVSFR